MWFGRLSECSSQIVGCATWVRVVYDIGITWPDFAQFPIGVRVVLAVKWQQDANIFTEDGTATIDEEAGHNAVKTITPLFEAGQAHPQLNYADSQQAFLNGGAAILVNGTWVVDFYTAEAANEDVALTNYCVAAFPTLFEQGATDGAHDTRGGLGNAVKEQLASGLSLAQTF